jgi:hypothetical protein
MQYANRELGSVVHVDLAVNPVQDIDASITWGPNLGEQHESLLARVSRLPRAVLIGLADEETMPVAARDQDNPLTPLRAAAQQELSYRRSRSLSSNSFIYLLEARNAPVVTAENGRVLRIKGNIFADLLPEDQTSPAAPIEQLPPAAPVESPNSPEALLEEPQPERSLKAQALYKLRDQARKRGGDSILYGTQTMSNENIAAMVAYAKGPALDKKYEKRISRLDRRIKNLDTKISDRHKKGRNPSRRQQNAIENLRATRAQYQTERRRIENTTDTEFLNSGQVKTLEHELKVRQKSDATVEKIFHKLGKNEQGKAYPGRQLLQFLGLDRDAQGNLTAGGLSWTTSPDGIRIFLQPNLRLAYERLAVHLVRQNQDFVLTTLFADPLKHHVRKRFVTEEAKVWFDKKNDGHWRVMSERLKEGKVA